ncbi:MAG: class I tRNA ligase family protein, partial [Fibrobacteres bacterium]|nr:class I tRNA ligase family protein [Fibrobacterota bacterium]
GHIEANPDFILPDFRRNEVLGFLRQPLNDLCISRPKSRLSWGITLPFAPDFVAYVWVDALFNYQSAVDGKTFPDGSPIWPADYHLIGKDILTTHAVYWPTLLKAVDAPLPKHILAHGWWLVDNARMSKTTGNVINPWAMKDKYSVDALRYFLIREMVVGQDASFTEAALIGRINSDLANDVGNGLSRILKLAATGLDKRLSPVAAEGDEEKALVAGAASAISAALDKVKALKLSFAVEDVLQLIRSVNRYLEVKAPWKLAKEGEAGKVKLNGVLYHAAEALRIGFSLLHPVMPAKMEEALAALGATPETSALRWGAWDYSRPLGEGVNLFPRIQIEGRIAAGEANDTSGISARPGAGPAKGAPPADPFSLVHLKVAEVASIEDHPNADSLYVLKIRLGAEERTICAGLKKHVPKDDLLGRKVVVVYNLKPANLRGVESQGMLLAAEAEGGKLAPVDPLTGAPGDDVRLPDLPFTPKADLTLKEFDKAPLSVVGGWVAYKGQALRSPKGPIQAQAPDGTVVH